MDEVAGVVAVGDDVGVGLLYSGAERGMLDKAMVDEKVLLAAGFAGEFGFGDVACDVGDVGLLVDGAEPFAVAVAEELADAFGKVACTEVVEQASVAGEGVVDVVVGEGYALEDFLDVAELNAVFFEEVTACGDVEEEVLDGDGGAAGAGTGALLLDLAAFDEDEGAEFVVVETAFELHLCDGGDGCKGFASEAHGVDGKEVVGFVYF